MTIVDLTLLRPWWLLALLPALWLLVRVWRDNSIVGDWQQHIDPLLRDHVLEGHSQRRSLWPLLCGAFAWLLAILALSGPVWEQRPVPAIEALQSRVIAMDVSRSMDTSDRKPSRMARAKFKLQDLLASSDGIETALLVFSEVAYVVSPLTDDRTTLEAFLPAIDTAVVPVQGSRLAPAIEKSIELLQQSDRQSGSILLITDATADAAALNAAKESLAKGYSVSVLAVATVEGAPVRLPDGSLLEDGTGNIAITRLDRVGLTDVARIGGGIYTEITNDSADLARIDSTFASTALSRGEDSETELIQWVERAPWLLLPLMCLSLLAFRRGVFS